MAFPIGEYLILLLEKLVDKHHAENVIILCERMVSGRKSGKVKD